MILNRLSSIFCVLIALLTASPAPAQQDTDPELRQLATELLDAMGSFRMMEEMFDQMESPLADQFSSELSDQEKERFRETMRGFKDGFVEVMVGPGGLVDVMAPIYAKHFTSEEMREAIAFYSSPLGKKMTDMSGEFGREMIEASISWAQTGIPKLIEGMVNDVREEAY